ncbi:hypothetical protein [Nocardioides deserti]|uniref:Uncharacterized protein n=1 Tax=Nocardioides deserti TaxID=1588644 RepID=A0ABR6UAI4_9ACTN|nr:hypothetical protein [Nocardioides deserti]MBC2961456.1 hypothetical protein [Nocardioides deserti]GGO78473.1 hypothetical protein GCM10012276_35970 [Nocardioides deserti]
MTDREDPTEQPLELGSDDLRLTLATLGARVHRLRVRDAEGAWRDVALGLPRVAGTSTTRSWCAASGPARRSGSGRVPDGTYRWTSEISVTPGR